MRSVTPPFVAVFPYYQAFGFNSNLSFTMANIYNKPTIVSKLKKSVPQGTDWLLNALNPFPDYLETPEGMPDASVQRTAVKKFSKTITISAPTGVVGNWDCFACFLPFDNAATSVVPADNVSLPLMDPYGQLTSFSVPNPNGNNKQGVVQIFSGPSGANLIPWASSFGVLSTEINGLSCQEAWAGQGSMRIVSAGFECTNVTPALYRGGTLTSFRQESVRTEVTATYAGFARLATVFSGYPQNLAECIRIPGSLQWNAEEGAYIVGTFDNQMSNFESPGVDKFYIASSSTLGLGSFPVLAGSSIPFVQSGATIPTHLDMSGMYATGLSTYSSLTFTLNLVLEIIPLTSSVMIDFIKPPVPYSPGLIEAYSLTKASIPAAAHKDDNDFGDFMKSVTSVLTPALSIAFPEFSPLFGAAAFGINKVVDYSRERKAKKQALPAPSTASAKQRKVVRKSPQTTIKAPRKNNNDEYRKMLAAARVVRV